MQITMSRPPHVLSSLSSLPRMHTSTLPRTMGSSTAPKPDLKHAQDPIAVIGMACRLPGNSNSPQDLWALLQQGGCARNVAPESRFNLKNHFDGSRKPHTLRSPGGMFLENIDLREFDAQFFSISRQEAIAMDPQQRQLLEVVYECLENAGISLQALNGAPVGCFVGSSTNGLLPLLPLSFTGLPLTFSTPTQIIETFMHETQRTDPRMLLLALSQQSSVIASATF